MWKNMEKYHPDHVCTTLPIIAHYELRFPNYLPEYPCYLNTKILPVDS